MTITELENRLVALDPTLAGTERLKEHALLLLAVKHGTGVYNLSFASAYTPYFVAEWRKRQDVCGAFVSGRVSLGYALKMIPGSADLIHELTGQTVTSRSLPLEPVTPLPGQQEKTNMASSSEQQRYISKLCQRVVAGDSPLPNRTRYLLGKDRYEKALQERRANGHPDPVFSAGAQNGNGHQPVPTKPQSAPRPQRKTETQTAALPASSFQPAPPTAAELPGPGVTIDLKITRSGETISISGETWLVLRLAQTTLNTLGSGVLP